MAKSMTIVQEKRGLTLTFRFEDDRLVRRYADSRVASETATPYADIDLNDATIETDDRLQPFRGAIWALGVAAAAGAAAPLAPDGLRAGLALAALAALGLEFARRRQWFAVRWTAFRVMSNRTREKVIRVLHEGQRERIVAELQRRWAEARQELVRIDFAADPDREATRFRTLCARGLIDAEECAAAIQRIQAARKRAERVARL
jgi:hypothetical protein